MSNQPGNRNELIVEKKRGEEDEDKEKEKEEVEKVVEGNEDEFKDLKEKLKLDRERALKRRATKEVENKEQKRRKMAEYQRNRYWRMKNIKIENGSKFLKNQNLTKENKVRPTMNANKVPTRPTSFLARGNNKVTINTLTPTIPVQCREKVSKRRAVTVLNNEEKRRKMDEEFITENDIPRPTTSFVASPKNVTKEITTPTQRRSTSKCSSSSKKTSSSKKSSKVPEKVLEERRKKVRERVQKFRSKLTEEQLEKKREYDRNYKLKRKAEGTWKKRENMSEREKRRERKLSRERTRRYREKQKQLKNQEHLEQEEVMETPFKEKSNKVLSGQKKKSLNRAKVYRRLNETLTKLKQSDRRAERYRKRLQRMKEKMKGSPSPGKRIRVLAGGRKVPTPVKRRLTYLECINTELEKKKKELLKGNKKDLIAFNKIVCSPVIRKKRLISAAKGLVGTNKTYKRGSCIIQRKTETARKLKKQTVGLVKQFYCLDINSKQLPGKKDYITRQKIQKQKRLLLYSLKDLWTMYNKQHPFNKVSYSTFRMLRPFWVVHPKLSDLDTCACQICDNMKLMYNKAKTEEVIDIPLVNLVGQSVCNKKKKSCMFNKCNRCINNTPLKIVVNNEEEPITFQQWKVGKRTLDNGKIIKVMEKASINCTKKELLEKLLRQLIVYKCHVFKIEHQFEEISILKETLKSNECLLHIDFSENYLCKMHKEIQSCHFGGTKRQLSLHTVVMYTKDSVQSICTVSENTDHKAEGVRAHLRPVLQLLHNEIDTIHIKSDGPSSQYKNRYNFYYIQSIKDICPQVKFVTWNFSVAGHGKGPSDGVGGTVKRAADSSVVFGHDVTDVKSFMKNVTEKLKSVTLIEVSSNDINEMKVKRPERVPEIKGISKVLQVTWASGSAELHLRDLSCFSCGFDDNCEHHNLGSVSVPDTMENPDNVLLDNILPEGGNEEDILQAILNEEWPNEDLNDIPLFGSPFNIEDIKQDVFLIVELSQPGKKTKSRKYVAVAQSGIDDESEVSVMFMKKTEDPSVFIPNEDDLSYVSVYQICGMLPAPELVVKGDRFSYKFEKAVQLE